MRARILDAAYEKGEAIATLAANPKFRRATRTMSLAYLAAERALFNHKNISPDRLGLVLAGGHGELEATALFLAELGKSGTARPLFFQNSLHNSTLGFLTEALKITGPALTLSNGHFGGEDALVAAQTLLVERAADYCLVIGVDAVSPTLRDPVKLLYPEGTELGEGAGAILLTSLPGEGYFLEEIEYPISSGNLSGPYYEADGIERIARVYKTTTEILLPKPDLTASRVRLSHE